MADDQGEAAPAPSAAGRWPWITIVVAALLVLNPVGLAFLYSAFLSGESLARNIAGPIVLIAALILAAFGFLEHLLWKGIKTRPNFPRSAPSPGIGPGHPDRTET